MGRFSILILFLFVAGCTFDASKIAGFSNPGVDWQKGKRLRISSDFQGRAKVEFAPDGSITRLDVTMSQNASPVIAAEGVRAESLPPIYTIQGKTWTDQTDRLAAFGEAVLKQLMPLLLPAPVPSAPKEDEKIDVTDLIPAVIP